MIYQESLTPTKTKIITKGPTQQYLKGNQNSSAKALLP